MGFNRRNFTLAVAAFILLPRPQAKSAVRDELARIKANVVFMRHALAPGTGDPHNFNINDCTTQRNLDEVGRKQAREIGAKLGHLGIDFNAIYSSQWCRCHETAQLLGLGPVETFAGLNSFFQGHAERETTLQLLAAKLSLIAPDELILCVTHQVVISAVTGKPVGSGQCVGFNAQTGESALLRL